jgi:hypothetical protein
MTEEDVESSSNGAVLTITLTNATSENILAYVLGIENLDKDGEVVSAATKMGIRGLIPPLPPSTKESFLPGESWTEKIELLPTTSGKTMPYRVWVDYVLFADSESWGPDSRAQSLVLQGITMGRNMERGRLRSLLHKSGDQAIMQDLAVP